MTSCPCWTKHIYCRFFIILVFSSALSFSLHYRSNTESLPLPSTDTCSGRNLCGRKRSLPSQTHLPSLLVGKTNYTFFGRSRREGEKFEKFWSNEIFKVFSALSHILLCMYLPKKASLWFQSGLIWIVQCAELSNKRIESCWIGRKWV